MRFCTDLFIRHGVFNDLTPKARIDAHWDFIPPVADRLEQRCHFTTLGRGFVHACHPPTKS